MKFSAWRLQLVVFALVSASFANIYITQPILPFLQEEFSVDVFLVSFSVSAVIMGIAFSNLPVGLLADKVPVQPVVLAGGIAVSVGGFVCASTDHFPVLIGGRFIQGLFIPAMTTCVAAYLAKTLPKEGLNVAMGSYVSATVLGGLGGRLIGGFLFPPHQWRYALISVSIFVLSAAVIAWKALPGGRLSDFEKQRKTKGYFELLKNRELLPIFFCGAGGLAIFSSVFNFLPFRLGEAPFGFSTDTITLFYLVYIAGIFIGPVAGRLGNRFGNGTTLIAGSSILGLSLLLILAPWVPAIVFGLLLLCTGFFTVHSAAVGSLNRNLSEGQGKANALYVLFYYAGGWLGITAGGFAFEQGGWTASVCLCMFFLIVPFGAGFGELGRKKRWL